MNKINSIFKTVYLQTIPDFGKLEGFQTDLLRGQT